MVFHHIKYAPGSPKMRSKFFPYHEYREKTYYKTYNWFENEIKFKDNKLITLDSKVDIPSDLKWGIGDFEEKNGRDIYQYKRWELEHKHLSEYHVSKDEKWWTTVEFYRGWTWHLFESAHWNGNGGITDYGSYGNIIIVICLLLPTVLLRLFTGVISVLQWLNSAKEKGG